VLNETEKRKPTFDQANSAPVKLADGQEWWLPKPWLQIHAAFQDGKAVSDWPVLTYGPEIDELIKAVGECKDYLAILCGVASLGAYMIQQNYELTDQDLDGLFAFRPGVPESWDWTKTVMETAIGSAGPKVLCGGVG
jgi:hypothetical protein